MTDEELLAHYVTGRRLADGRLAGVQLRAFGNAALHVGVGGPRGDEWTYDQHW